MPQTTARSDVVLVQDAGLSAALEAEIGLRYAAAPGPVAGGPAAPPNPKALAQRTDFIEGAAHDPNGFERIIGRSNLLSINFLARGRQAARAVCRIATPLAGGGIAYGTGFLVGPRLLLTNNHVLASIDEAAQSEAEFDFEHDLDGVLQAPIAFNLNPGDIFYTSRECDFTLVGVTPLANSGVALDRFGWLPLLPQTGKALDGEAVTIIQHPMGQPKQIAIHASRMVRLDPVAYPDRHGRFTHYTSDTEPGSSGAPVLNDQWQVVALHHKAVPDAASIENGTAPTRWIANEGVRISAVFRQLEHDRFQFGHAGRALDRLTRGIGFPPLAIASEDHGVGQGQASDQEQYAAFKAERWAAPDLGYDPAFLGADAAIALEPIYRKLASQGQVTPLLDGSGFELDYFHYSSVMHKARRFPLFTAVNIDGLKLIHPGERKDSWRPDRRIDLALQSVDAFYSGSKTLPPEPIYFSRGHLVRLLDPCWGTTTDDAVRGMQDTFHFTNAAPQVQKYNDIDWGNLEDYLLNKAQTSERKLTVFTGPIYRDDDPPYAHNRPGGPWQIPLSFWKVAVLRKSASEVAAAAFLIGQSEYVEALYEAKVFSGLKPYSIDEIRSRKLQTTVKVIEGLTGLDFGQVKQWDAQGGLESTRQTRWFEGLDDVMI